MVTNTDCDDDDDLSEAVEYGRDFDNDDCLNIVRLSNVIFDDNDDDAVACFLQTDCNFQCPPEEPFV